MQTLVDDLGLEQTLRAVGVDYNDLTLLATDAMKIDRLLVNNPRLVAYDDALALYREAF